MALLLQSQRMIQIQTDPVLHHLCYGY